MYGLWFGECLQLIKLGVVFVGFYKHGTVPTYYFSARAEKIREVAEAGKKKAKPRNQFRD